MNGRFQFSTTAVEQPERQLRVDDRRCARRTGWLCNRVAPAEPTVAVQPCGTTPQFALRSRARRRPRSRGVGRCSRSGSVEHRKFHGFDDQAVGESEWRRSPSGLAGLLADQFPFVPRYCTPVSFGDSVGVAIHERLLRSRKEPYLDRGSRALVDRGGHSRIDFSGRIFEWGNGPNSTPKASVF